MDIICKICNKNFNKWHNLTQHIRYEHNLSSQNYYDTYILYNNENKCKICGNDTKFLNISTGYRKYCSTKCKKMDPTLIEQARQTSIKKYGVTHYSKSTAWLESVKTTNNKKFGTDFVSQNEQVKQKIKQTNNERYGCDTYSQTNECKEKVKSTLQERYGVDYLQQCPEFRQKSIATCIEKYNVKNISQDDDIKNKKIITNHNRYGVDWFNNHEKSVQICIERYGVENPQQLHDIRTKSQQKYLYNCKSFDSSWELAYYIWLKDNKLDFKYQPKKYFIYWYKNMEHHYFPNFIVNNDYIEIKGNQFFENNKMINPYNRNMDDLYEAKHQCMIDNNVKIITDCTKYMDYVNNTYGNDYLAKFKRTNIEQIYNTLGDFPYIHYENLSLKTPYKIIQTYHKSIWSARLNKKLSPIDAWNDKNTLLKIISNRLIYQKPPYTPEKIRQGLNVTKIAPKVSVFDPLLAKRLIEQYLSDSTEIFDPFSGFSGRMLGSVLAGKKYIGHDINEIHVEESNRIIQDFNLNNCTVNVSNIFESTGTYETLFTCSPYGLKECWNKSETNMTCDNWIDECISRFKCNKYLFVVDETEKYKNNIVGKIENHSHFNKNWEYIVLI